MLGSIALAALAACGGTAEEPVVPTYGDIQRIFDGGCADAGCHRPDAANPDILDLGPGVSHGNLVGQPSTTRPGRTLVVAGDPDGSYLVCAADRACPDGPAVHRSAATPAMRQLSPASLEAIRRWIAAGALPGDAPPVDAGADEDAPVFAGLATATATGEHTIELTWATAVDRTPPSRVRYRVFVATSPGGQDFGTPQLTVTGVTTATLAGLTTGVRYRIVVRAVDEAGNQDGNTVEKDALTPDQTAPEFTGVSDVTAPAPASLAITWAAATDNVTAAGAIRYRIYLATTAGGQDFTTPTATATGVTTTTVAGLMPSTTYHVVVRAEDEAGNRDGNLIQRALRTLDTVAPTFAGVTTATGAAGAVQLTWAAGSDDTTAAADLVYLVYRATAAGGQDFAAPPTYTTPAGTTSFAAGGLSPSTTYHVVVRARDQAGNVDGNTVQRSATTQAQLDTTPPVFGGATSALALNATTIQLAWTPATDNTTLQGNLVYRIYRATSAGGQTFAVVTYTTTPGATTFEAGGLSPTTRYFFVVRAFDQRGNGDLNTVEVNAITTADTTAPTFGGLATATPVNAASINLGWTAASDDVSPAAELVYDVYRATTPGGQSFAAPTYTTPAGATSFVAGGLAASTTYHFVVRARDPAGNRDANTMARMATTFADVTVPTFAGATSAAPAAQSGRLDITWDPASDNVTPAGQMVYLLYASTVSGLHAFGAPPKGITAPGATSFTLTGLAASTTYFVVVRARDQAGNVELNTVEVSATTIADTTAPTFDGVTGAMVKTPTSARVSWAAGADDVTPPEELVYQVYVATSSGGHNFAMPAVTTAPGVNQAVVTGLVPATTYFFVVRARDASANVETNTAERDLALPAISLANHVTPILQLCAIVGCHSGAMPSEGLDLSSAAAIHGNLVNQFSIQCTNTRLVQPGASAQSYFAHKLLGNGPCFMGVMMPKVGSLEPDEIDTLIRWIDLGAPNN